MEELNSLIAAIKSLAEIDDELLTEESVQTILDNIHSQFAPSVVSQSINQIIKNLDDQGLNKADAREAIEAIKKTLNDLVYNDLELTGDKKILIDDVMKRMMSIFDSAIEKFHSYAIELPMVVNIEEGAKVPTYAHETDAAADLYAMEDIILEGHTYGNKIRTGVKIELPEGWLAMILPRSSIGAKTPLRLSNSVGLIDSGYRGELGILYDNISDTPYEIKAGDRIAQLLVMPSYRFQAKVVDVLIDSDRGETGFGDSGK